MPLSQNSANLEDTINSIPQGSTPTLITKRVIANGTYTASQDGVDGYSGVDVALPFESKEVTPSTIQQTVTPTPNTEYQALSQVVVKPTPLETLDVTPSSTAQTYTPQAPNIGFDSVRVGAGGDPNANFDAFMNNTLTEVYSTAQTVPQYCFLNKSAIQSVVFPNATTIGMAAFARTSSLENLNFSEVVSIDTIAFQFSSLKNHVYCFPKCESLGNEAFGRLSNTNPKHRFYFPALLEMHQQSHRNAYSIIVLKKQVNLSAYDATQFVTNVFYVPQRYFDWYTQTATNWVAAYGSYPNSIKTIEDNIEYLVGLGYDRNELLSED